MKNLLLDNTIKKIAVITFAGILTTISCNRDLLNKRPLNAISEDAVFTDPTFLQNYVYNVYNGIKPPWNPGSGSYETLTDIAVSQPETHDRAGAYGNTWKEISHRTTFST